MRFPAVSASRTKPLAAALLLSVTLGLGGCMSTQGGGGPMNAQASMNTGSGPTVTFESIDGPPPQVFERMVNLLDSEARLRNLPVVSRKDSAAFRVRSYLSAQVRGHNTSIAWVWDVYDRDQNRAFRLSGEEQTGKGSRDAWATADDLTLRRIAQAGLTGLSGVVNGSAPVESAPEPAPASRGGPAIASADEAPIQATAFADAR
ncbi:hypothetical protein RPMA_22090 [Tardiphaga alba]|uniref:Lipoprotein n=1 Tax=Tardiphaga alba TaxID=340268 RepID=A0ABX8ABT6_9BRAD|nr:hypothetical protein [Tardiphaga alba]QUS41234.1 hypothetical protein RPMA_22090 [Tardiphaga alba]